MTKEIDPRLPVSKLTKSQKRIETKVFTEDGVKKTIRMEIRYDDCCGNGHNSFAMTGSIYRGEHVFRDSQFECGGCIHEELAKHFPKFKKYLKWHLVSSDSPIHYLANALWHIGDKDCWGRRKGEPYRFETHIRFDDVPILHKLPENVTKWLREQNLEEPLEIIEIFYEPKNGTDYKFKPKYGFNGMPSRKEKIDWYDGIFDSFDEAKIWRKAFADCRVEFVDRPTAFGEGKEPDLEAAREAAKWPDAQPEDFTEEKMNARLPALMNEFKTAMEELGFVY